MQPNSILQSDILDIIFEHRNKNYGAYALRKYYDSRLIKAFGLMLLLIGIFLFIIFSGKNVLLSKPDILDPRTITLASDAPVIKKEPVKQPEKPKEPVMGNKIMSLTPGSIIKMVDDSTKTNAIANPDSSGNTVGDPHGIPGGKPLVKGPAGPVSVLPGPGVDVKKPDKNIPVLSPEIMPSFPGGDEALREFLKKNLVTPDVITSGEIVSVKARFIVGYDGSIRGIQITEDGGDQFNDEVIRVLKKMPKWNPGKTNGENVSVYYSIPIKFLGQE